MRLQNNGISIFLTYCFTSGLVVVLALLSPGASAGCTVTQDDGGTFTDTSVSSCADYYATTHWCHSHQYDLSCKRLNMFFAVDWNKADMINNAHRGVWGLEMEADVAVNDNVRSLPRTMSGAPENSFAGVVQGAIAGWRSLEYDIFRTTQVDWAGEYFGFATLGHYADLKGFTDYRYSQEIPKTGKPATPGAFLMNTLASPYVIYQDPSSQLWTLRDRDGFVSANNQGYEYWETFYSLVVRLLAPAFRDMVLVVDPKHAKELKQFRRDNAGKMSNKCIGFCGAYPEDVNKNESHKLVQNAVSSLKDNGVRHRAIFKLPQALFPSVAEVKAIFGDDFDHLLFAPQPDAGGKMNPEDVLAYIDGWVNEGDGKHIAFWDTAIKSNKHWMGKPFGWDGVTFDAANDTYADLTDYLKQKSGKRSAVWIQDLSGPGGRHGNYYVSYTNYPSDESDLRGDMFSTLYLSYAKNAVITTDRPDIFVQAKRYLKSIY